MKALEIVLSLIIIQLCCFNLTNAKHGHGMSKRKFTSKLKPSDEVSSFRRAARTNIFV